MRLFKQLKRDHRTIGLITIAPIFFIILFGFAFGGEIENIPIVIINKDSDAGIGSSIVDYLQESSRVKVSNSTSEFDDLKPSVDDKIYVGAILIPVNFTYNFLSLFGEDVSI